MSIPYSRVQATQGFPPPDTASGPHPPTLPSGPSTSFLGKTPPRRHHHYYLPTTSPSIVLRTDSTTPPSLLSFPRVKETPVPGDTKSIVV